MRPPEWLMTGMQQGSGYKGILANDSIYYPGLMCGEEILFEMRGENRPVVDYYGFLAGRDASDAGRERSVHQEDRRGSVRRWQS